MEESKKLKVSVIVPVYNAEEYLSTCLKSILNQDLKDIEIICIDDGSEDNSYEILEKFSLDDPRIICFHQDNKGVSYTRNKGIEMARGEYLCFVDADDYIHPSQLSCSYKHAVENNADIVMFGGKTVPSVTWADRSLRVANGKYIDPFYVLFNIQGVRPFSVNKLFKTQLLKEKNIKFDLSLVLGEDQAFLFDIFPFATTIVALDKTFYYYRQNQNSAMAYWNKNIDSKVVEHLKIIKHVVKKWTEEGFCKDHGLQLARWILQFVFRDLQFCQFNFRRSAYKEILEIVFGLTKAASLPEEEKKQISYMQEVICPLPNPKVSVIVPVYNAEEYLPEALFGLTAQAYPFFEMIFVDDGSSDDTLKILNEYASKDERVKVYAQAHSYAGAARNLGIKEAKGEYFLFLDADDIFSPDLLKKALEKIEKTAADICVFSADQLDNKSRKKKDLPWVMAKRLCPQGCDCFSIETNPKNIFAFTTAAPWNKLFRADFIRKHGLTFQTTRSANDVAFVCTALALASKIAVLDDVLISYRVNNEKSLQGSQDKKAGAFYEALLELKNRLHRYDIYGEAEPAFLNFALDCAFYNLRTLKTAESYEQIYNLIRNELIPLFEIDKKADSYFYGYPSNHIVDKRHDVQNLEPKVFAQKWGDVAYKVNNSFFSVENREVVEVPKISVIIPILNSEENLEECLTSVIRQSLEEMEIICVDTESTNGTTELIKKYSNHDKRIVLLHSDKKGFGHQVNMGIQCARGEYLAIVEPDDLILSDMYKTLYEKAKRFQVDFVKCDFTRFHGKGNQRSYSHTRVLNGETRYNVVGNPQEDLNWFNAHSLVTPAIYSLKFLRDNRLQLNETTGASCQDNAFWFQLLMNAERILFYPHPFYQLRRDKPNSSVISQNKVYTICEEYDFIYSLFAHEKKLLKKYAPICAKLRLMRYDFTLERIPDQCKLDFLLRYSEDFYKILSRGELHGELFSDSEWQKLMKIIEDPIKYYFEEYIASTNRNILESPAQKKRDYEAEIKTLEKKLRVCEAEIESLQEDIRSLQNSVSFRIGRQVTWFPRLVRGGYRCYLDHGFTFTIRRIIEHLGVDMHTGNFRR